MSKDTFLSKLANHIQSHYDLTKQELTVVFPNKRAAFYLRNAFKENSEQTFWLPQIISIEEAVTQWSGIALADNIDLLFELIDIDAQLHKGRTRDLNIFGSQAIQMAKDFDEIDQYGIDAKALFNFVLANKQLDLWNVDTLKSKDKEQLYLEFFNSLYDYYFLLRNRLNDQKKGYYGMITRYLAELQESELLSKSGEQQIVFAGFNALTATEEHIIDTLIKNNKAEIFFDYDHYYVDDKNNEAGYFARKYMQSHLDWLTNGISDALMTEKKKIHIISAGGNTLQIKALQSKLQNKEEKDAAIILADEKLLIPVLNAIPNSNTYRDFNVSMGYPVKNTPVNQLVSAIFAIQKREPITRKTHQQGTTQTIHGWYIWPVIRLMDLEIVKIVFPKKELDIFNNWKNTVVKEGKFIFETSDYNSLESAPHLCGFLKAILNEQAEKTPQSVLHDLETTLKLLSNTINTKEDKEKYYFLLNQISEIGRTTGRLSLIMKNHGQYIRDLQSIEILYRMLISGMTLKLNSQNTGGLQIMGVLETRNIDFNRLHMLSVNEGIMPKEKPQGSFIPQYIRRAFNMPGYTESQAISAYHFYRLLQNGEDIYLYYNNLDITSGGEASRYILQIKNELAQNSNITIDEESFDCIAETGTEVKDISATKEGLADWLRQLILGKGLSPSSLSTYTNCPFKYYLKYVEQIRDDNINEEIGSNITGNIIHDTLEYLFEDYLPKDNTTQIIDKQLFDNRIKPQWEEKLAKAIGTRQPRGFSDMGYNYLKIVNIRQQIERYLRYMSEQLKQYSLVILKTEGDLEILLPTPMGDCRFYGRADRIDKLNGITRVIDYKTGHVELKDVNVPARLSEESDLDYIKRIPEKALQLLIYKYLYLKTTNSKPEEVTAAIHGLKYKNIAFNLTFEESESPYLGNATFINDMEVLLKAVVGEMLDPSIPFVQAEDDKKCSYCEFKLICKR